MAFAAPLALAATAAGAGIQAYGAISGGQAQKSAMYYRAAIAKNNQIIAEQNATSAIEAGQAKGQIQGLKGRAVGGAIRANQGRSGVDVNTGSNVDVQEAQREQSQLDTETVLHNADLQAYGYRTQATNYAAEAELDKKSGDDAQTAGYLKAAGGLLSSAGSLGMKWNGTSPGTTPSPSSSFIDNQPEDI